MVPNSGHVLNLAACANPAIAVALVDLLVQHGARLEDSLPLHLAAECPPYQSSRQPTSSSATSHPPAQVGLDPDSSSTPSSSRIPVLQHLLDLGYDPNASDGAMLGARALGTPLHWAVRWGRMENARFLLENGADPRGKDRHGRDALEAADQDWRVAGNREIVNVIKEFM